MVTGVQRAFKTLQPKTVELIESYTTVTLGDQRMEVKVTGFVILINFMAQSDQQNWIFTTFDQSI